MDIQVAAMASSAVAEALKSWGSYALVLMLLAAVIWQLIKNSKAKDEEIAKLRAANADLQETRLQEAKAMIEVTKSGTATIAARSAGDQEFLTVITKLVDKVSAIDAQLTDQQRRPRSR